MTFVLPFTHPTDLEVFAVEDTVAQVTWRRLPDGVLGAVAHHPSGPAEQLLDDAGEPGAADLVGFTSGTSTLVDFTLDGRPFTQRIITTEPRIDGRTVAKFATISDLHLGEHSFGVVRKFRENDRLAPYALRCALAAVAEAQTWGAELIVIKGDITELSRPQEWELFDELLDAIEVPVLAIPGNHDTVGKSFSVDATEALRSRGLFSAPVTTHDIAGARLVLADSTVARHSWGRLNRWRDELCEAISTDAPAMLFTHHHLEDRAYPWFWPLGVQRFDNAALVRALTAANPDLLISSGHTHRNRVRHEHGAVITEVSATKDFPGVWAGYTVHENGVRQTVRRIAEPSCVSWTERTHAVVAGLWGRWSPGRLDDRVVTKSWSVDRATVEVGASVSTGQTSSSLLSDSV